MLELDMMVVLVVAVDIVLQQEVLVIHQLPLHHRVMMVVLVGMVQHCTLVVVAVVLVLLDKLHKLKLAEQAE